MWSEEGIQTNVVLGYYCDSTIEHLSLHRDEIDYQALLELKAEGVDLREIRPHYKRQAALRGKCTKIISNIEQELAGE